jgi:heme oxygenase
MILAQETKELHHAAERHEIGGSMADGTISAPRWREWLSALLTVHGALDPHMPESLWRVVQIEQDLSDLNLPITVNWAAHRFAETMTNEAAIAGAAYVFTGAHLMGGAVMERRLGHRLPCAHLRWADRQEALRAWRPMRERADAVGAAKDAFAAVISIMDEITGGK